MFARQALAARRALVAPKPAGALIVFRVALGVLVSISAIRFLAYGWVDDFFVKPKFYFTYWGFSWVRPLPPTWMHALFVGLAILGVCFAAGLFYRLAAILLFFGFAYVQLVDVTNWLNHYYLVALLLLLTSLMPLGRAMSLDSRLFPKRRVDVFPAWCTYLLRFQVAVVYVHAGLAKATSDWLLHAQPLNIWLSSRTGTPLVGSLFDERTTAFLFSWSGFLFDTTVVAFLLWRRTRVFAYVVVIVFHATTWLLFPIGMFPFIMCASALVFMSADWPSRFLPALAPAGSALPGTMRPLAIALGALFCVVQLLAPLRSHLYGGNVLWHEQGMRFAWKVMVREKNGSIMYVVESPREHRTWYVSPQRYLTDHQERELSSQPNLVLQLAHHVRDDFHARGHDDVLVRVEALVSLNGRAPTAMIDPAVDLARASDGLGKASWILPEPEGPPIHLKPASAARFTGREDPGTRFPLWSWAPPAARR